VSLSYYLAESDPWGHDLPARASRAAPPDPSVAAADAPLVDAVRAGDPVAFRQVFDSYAAPLLGFVYAKLGSRERAEDLVQQLFASIWLRHAHWEVTTTIGAYLFRAVRNLIAREFRDRGVETRALQLVADAPTERSDTDAALSEHELRMALAQALRAMPARPREVFLLSREQCLSYAEIAATLGIAVKTVELHMARALTVLRSALAEWRV